MKFYGILLTEKGSVHFWKVTFKIVKFVVLSFCQIVSFLCRNQQEYCALVIQNWWRLKLNEKRRNVRTPPAPPSTTEDNYSTSSVSLSVSSGPPSRAATRLSGQTSTMISAARVIQKAWRRHVVHG